jgi:hypothetical protein
MKQPTQSARVLRAAERALEVAADESDNANETLAALALANAAACHTAGMTEDEAVRQFRIAFNSPPRKDAPPRKAKH